MVKNKSASLGLISSLAASLCCITPMAAALGGVSGVAATFTWIEPVRPYLIAGSVLMLGLAWFQKLRLQKNDVCSCVVPKKRSVLQSTRFLSVVTVLAVLLMTFPSYAHLFYAQNGPISLTRTTSTTPVKQVEFTVKGMGCASCEPEVETAVGKLSGIHGVKASAIQKNTVVQFDSTKTSTEAIREAINSTGYTVQHVKL